MAADPNDTLIFVRVVQAGSFTAAARLLCMPKTTVSRRVMTLEAQLGVQLLHRTTRRLGLTEAGSLYYSHCRNMAAQLDEAHAAVSQLQSGPRGWLRVTLPYSFGTTWIAPLLAGFRQAYPDVRLEILASHVPLDLVADEIDIALRLGVLADSDLVARRLGSFATGVYASPSYLMRHGVPEHPGELGAHRALTLHQARRAVGYAWPLRKPGGRAQYFALDPVIVASDPALIHDALCAGEGLTLAMHQSMAADHEAGRVRRVLSDWSGPAQDFNALFPRGRVASPKVRAFVDYLRDRLVSHGVQSLE
ncbi:LysR family transcriptional regulator [Burkholderia thailandensis]|uniref:LysR family transcriptional regulator n=1 Tax=Burkholderia thailandensis TaxID=57975 RepID=UPI00148EB198|nr:LysR family transcriptional regulator [Burkholderia thailandensis]NOK53785.1 LysR family transcriptional regulator [Burkholderia thailandensis]